MMNVIRIDKLEVPELSSNSVANLIIVMQELDRDATSGLDQAVREQQKRLHDLEQMVWNDRRTRAERKSLLARWWPRRA